MCVIMVQPQGKTIPDECLVEGLATNRDGWGIAVVTGDEKLPVVVEKGFTSADLLKTYKKYEGKPVAVHCRIGTSGKKNLSNLHPYEIIKGKLYLMHNGVLHNFTDRRSDWSDTWHLAQHLRPFFLTHGLGLLKEDFFQSFLQKVIGSGNKLTFITPEGFVIINAKAGTIRDEIWYSNGSAFTGRRGGSNSYWAGFFGDLDDTEEYADLYVWDPTTRTHVLRPKYATRLESHEATIPAKTTRRARKQQSSKGTGKKSKQPPALGAAPIETPSDNIRAIIEGAELQAGVVTTFADDGETFEKMAEAGTLASAAFAQTD